MGPIKRKANDATIGTPRTSRIKTENIPEQKDAKGNVKQKAYTKETYEGYTPQGADATSQADRQGAVGGVDTGGTGDHHILSNYDGSSSNIFKWSYKKNWKFYSHAWSRSLLTDGSGANQRNYMTTSMAAIPIDYPIMYMNQAEYDLLPIESYVTNVHQNLTLLNCRTSFQANASDVATATQGNQLYMDFAKGIEAKHPVIIVKNVGTPGQPAKVSAISPLVQSDITRNLRNKLYGKYDYTDTYPPGICGTWQEWEWYAAFILTPYNFQWQHGYWAVDNAYDSFVAVTNYNTHIASNSYDFGITLLKGQRDIWVPGIPNIKSGKLGFLHKQSSYLNQGEIQYSIANNTYTQIDSSKTVTPQTAIPGTIYDSLWHPSIMKFDVAPKRILGPPKWMYFGLQDIPTITSTTDDIQYQEGQAFWELECTISRYSKFDTVTCNQARKPYFDQVVSFTKTDITAEDRGQGFIFGKPYSELE
jgi:hypothetical protein